MGMTLAMPEFRSRPTIRARELRNNATEAERKLWRHLSWRQLKGCKFSRQLPMGPFICDFLCREECLVIEVDGGQHADSLTDARRTAYLNGQGYRVLRFWNHDVLGNIDGVLTAIVEAVGSGLPPAPPASGRGVRSPSRLREGKSREAARGWA